jgi:hypothetical protein
MLYICFFSEFNKLQLLNSPKVRLQLASSPFVGKYPTWLLLHTWQALYQLINLPIFIYYTTELKNIHMFSHLHMSERMVHG